MIYFRLFQRLDIVFQPCKRFSVTGLNHFNYSNIDQNCDFGHGKQEVRHIIPTY
jgi:hypothetical protein